MDRNLHISITTGTILKILLCIAGAWLLFHLRDLVLVVLTAIVIASAIEPGVARLQKWRVPRILGVILIYVGIIGGFVALFYFFLPTLLSDAATFLSQLPTYLDAFGRSGAFNNAASTLGISSLPTISGDTILAGARGYLSGISTDAFAAAANIFGGVLSFILVLIFSFYFTVIHTGVEDFLRVIVPLKQQDYVVSVWKRARHKIGLWMQGQLLLALIMGVLVYLGLTILGIKHALVFAAIAAVFEIIPVFGPVLAAVPAVAVGFVDGGASLGLLTIALYVIFQQFENHLIYPLVVTKVVGVPPLLVVLSLLVGAELAGFWGILLSVPVAATIQELARDLQTRRTSELPRA